MVCAAAAAPQSCDTRRVVSERSDRALDALEAYRRATGRAQLVLSKR